MIKKWIYYTSIILVVAFISSAFRTNQQNQTWFFNNQQGSALHLFPSEDLTDYPSNVLYTGKSFTGFKEAVAFKESQGQYNLVNSYGYMGKYQFGGSALRAIGITNKTNFLKNPQLQEKAFNALLSKNKSILKDEIQRYEGKFVAGIEVTESGILAAAHLLGAGSVKKFLRNNGDVKIVDGYGTSLRSYLKRYSGYDTSHIVADQNPQI